MINKKQNPRGTETTKGGKILIIGDTHFSESFQGSHKNYLEENIWLMKNILEKIGDDTTGLIFLGDMFGVKEQRLKSLLFRSSLMNFFKEVQRRLMLNNKRKGMNPKNAVLACVKGNHDMSGVDSITEFEFFIEQGLFTNPEYVDVCNQDGLKARLHFLNYGEETKEMPIAEGANISNVVLGHGEYLIADKTTWFYNSKHGVNITDMPNLWGIDLIISGHIHTPSTQFDATVMENGEVVKLFYPGSPARVSERIPDVFYIEMVVGEGGELEVEVKNFGLPSVEDVFIAKEENAGEERDFYETDAEAELRTERLKEILEDIISSRLSQGNLLDQIDRVPAVSNEARGRAKGYLQAVI